MTVHAANILHRHYFKLSFNLNLKCSFSRPVMLLYFMPESLDVAVFCVFFRCMML